MSKKEPKFKNISYDLSQNFLYYRGNIVTLYNHSLLVSAVYFLKKNGIFELFEKLIFGADGNLSNLESLRLVEKFVQGIEKKIYEYFLSEYKFSSPDRSKIHYVVLQVIFFIRIDKIFYFDEKDLIIKNLIITSQGTVNIKKTINRMLEKGDLTPYHKLMIAAQFLVNEETVIKYFEQLTESEKIAFDSHIKTNLENSYWIWQIKRSPKGIPLSIIPLSLANKLDADGQCTINGDEIQRYDIDYLNIFRRAVRNRNEMAIHYLWENFISKMIHKESIMNEIILSNWWNFTYLNIVMYFLLKVIRWQLMDFFDSEGFKIPMLIFSNPRFKVIFFEVFESLRCHFDFTGYLILLSFVTHSYHNRYLSESDSEFIKNLYNKIPKSYKEMLVGNDESREINFYLLLVPFEKANFDLVETFLKNCSMENIFNFLSSDYGMQLFEISVRNFELDFIYKILNIKFGQNREFKKKIKVKFLETKAYRICSDLIFNGIEVLNKFLSWFTDYVKSTKMNEFLNNFLRNENFEILKKFIFTSHNNEYNDKAFEYVDDVLILIDKNLTYPAKKRVSLLEDVGNNQSYRIKCYSNVCECIYQARWGFLQSLITWKNCTDEERRELGRKLLKDSSFCTCILKSKNELEYFYDFTDFFIKELLIHKYEKALKNLKINVLNNKSLIFPLIIKKEFTQFKRFIQWCDQQRGMLQEFKIYLIGKLERNCPYTEEETEELNKFLLWIRGL
ncbi:UNVERIFIED_CONTAM: hypothetical protein RMT77_019329 [Armadillidium vulgare]